MHLISRRGSDAPASCTGYELHARACPVSGCRSSKLPKGSKHRRTRGRSETCNMQGAYAILAARGEASSQTLVFITIRELPMQPKFAAWDGAACLSGGCASPHKEVMLSCRVLGPVASDPSIGRLVLYQFLRCDLSCCYSTSAMLLRAPPGGQIRVTGDARRDEKNIAQSFHHAYKLTIYTWFIPLHRTRAPSPRV